MALVMLLDGARSIYRCSDDLRLSGGQCSQIYLREEVRDRQWRSIEWAVRAGKVDQN